MSVSLAARAPGLQVKKAERRRKESRRGTGAKCLAIVRRCQPSSVKARGLLSSWRMGEKEERLRRLPAVQEILQAPGVVSAGEGIPRALVRKAAQEAIASARERLLSGDGGKADALAGEIAREVEERLSREKEPGPVRVINATGVIVHTNLGRAPLAAEALDRLVEVARGYSTLEYDLSEGQRGSRQSHVEKLLVEATGAGAAIAVNNNAAAVMLVLAALVPSGKEVLVSRGELVEIGGSFRVPDILRLSGAKLVEVGTTNRTHLKDFEAAVSPETALILKVHPSNFRVVGFTAEVPDEELGKLARATKVPFVADLG